MPWSWNWDLPVPGEGPLVEMYKKAHPDAPYPPNNEQLGLGYAAGIILRQALEKAASRDGTKIRDALAGRRLHRIAAARQAGGVRRDGVEQIRGADPDGVDQGNAHTVWPKDMQAMQPVL